MYLHHLRNKRHAIVTCFFLFGAFLLFLLVALSLPIIKPIYVLEISANIAEIETSVATQLRFGVWGFCASRFASPLFSTSRHRLCLLLLAKRSEEADRTILYCSKLKGSTTECVGPKLGYTLNPQTIAAITNDTNLVNVILNGLTILLVLHPVAAGLALLTLLPAIASCFVYHKLPWIISLVLSVPTAIVSSIVFSADLALVIVARDKIKSDSILHFSVDFGNGVWMVLVSTLFTWIAMVLLSARVCPCFRFAR
jgi:hypothetical protein